jgi:hypothetical protein
VVISNASPLRAAERSSASKLAAWAFVRSGCFHRRADASIWEEAKEKGRSELERLIAAGLTGTTVTAVLIGSHTASRPWVAYEIQQSIKRGNGLIGVRVHKIKDPGRRA